MNDRPDRSKIASILGSLVPVVFAEMTFIDVEEAPGGAPTPGSPPAGAALDRAAIDILQPLSCRLELAASPALRLRIADILFGDTEARSRDDAFLELLNVVAGGFITEFFGPGSEAKLELPRYLFAFDEPLGDFNVTVTFDAEGETLAASFSSVRYRY